MSDRAETLRALVASMPVERADARLGARPPTSTRADQATRWSWAGLSGRLTEISGVGAVAPLTSAFGLILDAQTRSEPAAWVSLPETHFYPPDAAAGGVDLDALAVVMVPGVREAGRAAEHLLRSGAFGLVVLDLGRSARLPPALQGRLVGLAKHHDAALVCITEKPRDAASLGTLVSLRTEVVRAAHEGAFACELTVLKDKSRGPGWTQREVVHGPAGLR
ncbi:recombinase A [Haliangium sp.]|uniref:recombinase A n=1 Tax=Haliangium sp. TaxID=2663208 RepID=UPI003D0D3459